MANPRHGTACPLGRRHQEGDALTRFARDSGQNAMQAQLCSARQNLLPLQAVVRPFIVARRRMEATKASVLAIAPTARTRINFRQSLGMLHLARGQSLFPAG